ncbi:hypothetical protein ANCCAN_25875, partial [Ancylostoma caninum]
MMARRYSPTLFACRTTILTELLKLLRWVPSVQYLLPLMILSCAYYRVGVVLRKNQAVGDSRHAKSIAA